MDSPNLIDSPLIPSGDRTVVDENRITGEVDVPALLRLAGNGTAWTLTSYSLSMALRLAGNIILSRLLAPQHFGLMTLLNTFIIGLDLFSDLGLIPNIIRNELGDDPAFLNTAWTMQALRGILLWVICIFLSGPVARFYGQPELRMMFIATGLIVVIAGFDSTKLATLARHLAVREVVLLELKVQVSWLAFSIIWCVFQPTVWALIAGRLFSHGLKVILSHRLSPKQRNRFSWDRETVRSLFVFGRWIFISTALTFVASQSDRLILGKLVSLTTLGLYGIAFALADIPRQIIFQFSGRVALPFVSKFASLERKNYRRVILRYRRPVLLVAAFVLALVVNSGDWVLTHLYDHRYHSASWIVPILALGLWHTLLYSTANPCLVAIGTPRYNALGYLLSALAILLVTPWTFRIWGLPGAIWTIAFSDVPMYLANAFGLFYEDIPLLGQDLKATLVFGAICGLLFWLRTSVGMSFPPTLSLR